MWYDVISLYLVGWANLILNSDAKEKYHGSGDTNFYGGINKYKTDLTHSSKFLIRSIAQNTMNEKLKFLQTGNLIRSV